MIAFSTTFNYPNRLSVEGVRFDNILQQSVAHQPVLLCFALFHPILRRVGPKLGLINMYIIIPSRALSVSGNYFKCASNAILSGHGDANCVPLTS